MYPKIRSPTKDKKISTRLPGPCDTMYCKCQQVIVETSAHCTFPQCHGEALSLPLLAWWYFVIMMMSLAYFVITRTIGWRMCVCHWTTTGGKSRHTTRTDPSNLSTSVVRNTNHFVAVIIIVIITVIVTYKTLKNRKVCVHQGKECAGYIDNGYHYTTEYGKRLKSDMNTCVRLCVSKAISNIFIYVRYLDKSNSFYM